MAEIAVVVVLTRRGGMRMVMMTVFIVVMVVVIFVVAVAAIRARRGGMALAPGAKGHPGGDAQDEQARGDLQIGLAALARSRQAVEDSEPPKVAEQSPGKPSRI